MFAAKMGFYYKAPVGPVASPYWVMVFDDFTVTDIAVNSVTAGKDYSMVVGSTGTGTSQRGVLLSIDDMGTIVFQEQMDIQSNLRKVIITDDANVAVAGTTSETGSSLPYLGLYDTTGSLIWEKYNSTSFTINGIEWQQTPTGSYNLLAVGSSSKQMSFDGTTGAINVQNIYGNMGALTSVTATQNGPYSPSYSMGVDTTTLAYDTVTIIACNNTGVPYLRRRLGNNTGFTPSSNVRGMFRAFRLQLAAIDASTNKPVVILCYTDPGSGSSPAVNYNSNIVLEGTVTGAFQYVVNNERGFYAGATQTNNTIWSGKIEDDLASVDEQRNFYFGTAGTDNTTLTTIAASNDNGYDSSARYIVGTTDYYGTTKSFIARLPIDGTIPGTGTYGASGEIHYEATSYMDSISSLTLTNTNISPNVSSTSNTVTSSAIIMDPTTLANTLTQVP